MRRFASDEAGMTMGLTVIMIALIGVMGAGLLAFVQRDLEAVIEVNQGQKGLEMADAGVEAGKRQILFDSEPTKYDGGATADSEWSYSGAGKTLDLGGDRVNVTIRYLTPSTTVAETKEPNRAPEVLPSGSTSYADRRDYFKVTAQGTSGDANRRVEAVYRTRSTGFPPAYFATGNITFNGNAFSIDDVSVFSEADVVNLRGDKIGGCDTAFGDWNAPPWNVVPRSATSGVQTRNDGSTCTGYPTGVASEGTIDYQSGAAGRPNVKDYSFTSSPKFVDNTWTATGGSQNAGEITYPFNPDENTHIDLDTLRAAAESGQNGSKLVRRPPGDTNFRIEDYPANSSKNTVYYVEFSNADGTFTTTPGGTTAVAKGSVEYSSNAANATGTIVVVNGDFRGSPSEKTFTGTVLLRDPVDTDLVRMAYVNSGNFKLQGFVNVEGTMEISGNADSATPASVIQGRRLGAYVVERWAWRECYSTTCD